MKLYYTLIFLLPTLFAEFVNAGFFSKRGVVITNFHYNECVSKYGKNEVLVENLSIMSNTDGDLIVSGSINSHLNITAPVNGRLNLARSVLGIKIPVPCIMNFGTCKYADLCKYGIPEDKSCPSVLEENDIPCRCPILEGRYNLPVAQFPIGQTRWAQLLSGSYFGTIRIESKNVFLTCYTFQFEMQ